MKLIQTILFGVFLTTLIHVQTSNALKYNLADIFTTQWREYIRCLETWLDATDNVLSFTFRYSVIRDLEHTTDEFTEYLLDTVAELSKTQGAYSIVAALQKTIDFFYDGLLKRTIKNGNKLKTIKAIDPLGFEAFLKIKNERDVKDLDIDECVDQYLETMYNRVILQHCLNNASSVKDPELNANGKLNSIPRAIRKELATEYAPISEATINHFVKIAAKQFPKTKIYRVRENKVHEPKETDGLRILSAGRIGPKKVHNWLCVKYNSYTRKLHVYDNVYVLSTVKSTVQPIQEAIFKKMFPDSIEPIEYDKSKTPQADPASSGLYAIIFAATSLNGEDPAKTKFQINDMYGDPAIYMRLHILKMFANNRLSPMY